MKLILASQKQPNTLFVAIGNKLIKVSVNDLKKIDTLTISNEDKVENSQISNIAIDQEETIVIAAYDNKILKCWSLDNFQLLGTTTLKKKPTSVICSSFTSEGKLYKVAVISDKAGDLWVVRAPDLTKEMSVAGHTASVITEIASNPINSFVASADRDEKIRVSKFPDFENIDGFCLGHKSVVSSVQSIAIQGVTYLISSGWDNRLILWDLATYNILDELSFREESKPVTTEISEEDQEGEEVEAEVKEGEEEEGEDFEADKTYDENAAGNYPFKVITHPTGNYVLVLFKDECFAKLFKVESSKIISCQVISLAKAPLDASFQSESSFVILTSPNETLKYYQINQDQAEDLTNTIVEQDALQSINELAGNNIFY